MGLNVFANGLKKMHLLIFSLQPIFFLCLLIEGGGEAQNSTWPPQTRYLFTISQAITGNRSNRIISHTVAENRTLLQAITL